MTRAYETAEGTGEYIRIPIVSLQVVADRYVEYLRERSEERRVGKECNPEC